MIVIYLIFEGHIIVVEECVPTLNTPQIILLLLLGFNRESLFILYFFGSLGGVLFFHNSLE